MKLVISFCTYHSLITTVFWCQCSSSGCVVNFNCNSLCHYMCAHVFPAVQNLGRPYWLTLSPMYLWMLVFFTRPHKEERFLFPIYPLICLSGAVALSSLQVCSQHKAAVCVFLLIFFSFHLKVFSFFFSLQKCYHFLFQRYRLEHYTVSSNWLALSAVMVFTVLSLSRSVALFRGL